jgi:hypothetical protein
MPVPTTNPLDYAALNLDDKEARAAFYHALNDAGREETGVRLRKMRANGIIGEDGKRISTRTPPDMLDPNASVEQ